MFSLFENITKIKQRRLRAISLQGAIQWNDKMKKKCISGGTNNILVDCIYLIFHFYKILLKIDAYLNICSQGDGEKVG